MKSFIEKCGFIMIFFLFFFSCTNRYNTALQKELTQMVEKDQEARIKSMTVMMDSFGADKDIFSMLKEMDEETRKVVEKIKMIDEENTERMKEIISEYGWPGYKLVGRDGSNNAWLLVQHSEDNEFQKECLVLLEKAARNGDASWKNVAYLTDKILVGEGKKQIYGTQFKKDNGNMVPYPIEDAINVNKRREEVGLGTLEDYMIEMNKR
jgi:hypothetical protein